MACWYCRVLEALGPDTEPALPPLAAREREALIAALQQAGGVQLRAARLLGISPRVMHYKVHRYHLGRYCAIRRRT